MALNFKQLRDPKVGLLDKITFGKLKDCRVCDVIEDHYEYLIWAEKQGYVKFQEIVVETIKEVAGYKKWQPIEEHDSQDDVRDMYEKVSRIDYDWEDDVPF